MKKAVVIAIVMLTGVSAMAQYYPGPPPPPPGPVYYPGNGGYHGGGGYGRTQQDDQMSAMSAVTAAMFASLAISCASGPGCAYKVVNDAKEEVAVYQATGEMGPYLAQGLDFLSQKDEFRNTTLDQKLQAILDFKPQ